VSSYEKGKRKGGPTDYKLTRTKASSPGKVFFSLCHLSQKDKDKHRQRQDGEQVRKDTGSRRPFAHVMACEMEDDQAARQHDGVGYPSIHDHAS
jgi:hypothetical protein